MSKTVELRIHGIAAGGAGVGRLPDGRVAFVQRTAPDETVRARIVEEKRRWVRADLLRVLEPSPVRRAAPCPHYRNCGGCTIEHLEYPAQLQAKSGIVEEQRACVRAGLLRVLDPSPVRATAACLHKRNCGGCIVERVEYPAQLRAKSAIVGDALGRMVALDAANPEVTPTPEVFSYR